MAALSNGRVVKIGIVTDDAAETAKRFAEIFPVSEPPCAPEEPELQPGRSRSWHYRGQALDEAVALTVANVHTENFWFELIQPPEFPANPWYDHLKAHGTSVMWVTIHVEDGFETGIAAMKDLGYEATWVEDKGFEQYAYFDTLAALGLLVETKETAAR
jgi:hypothetical protein